MMNNAPENYSIRDARLSDVPALARVGVDTWRSTYSGIMADDHLDALSYEKSENGWRERLLDPTGFTYVAEGGSGQVAGYAYAGLERDGDKEYPGELYALYVLKEHQGFGIGKELVRAVAKRFTRDGIDSMIVWVLSANPFRSFYERLGGQVFSTKIIEIGGRQLEETAYAWHDLSMLQGG